MSLDDYARQARALRAAQESARVEALARFARQARALLDDDLAQRREALAQLADPADPALGPLPSLLDAVERGASPERARRLLAWALDPARGRALAGDLWAHLWRALAPERGELDPALLRGLRVSPELGGEPWGSLDLFAWSPEGFCAAFALAYQERDLRALLPRLPHHAQRVEQRFGARAAQDLLGVVVSPKGRLSGEVQASGWRPLSWHALWDALCASSQRPSLSPAERLWAAQIARELERCALRDSALLSQAQASLAQGAELPPHALVCHLQAALVAGVR